MQLSQLLSYDNIIIQCHNNPDADAIASGMALDRYLKSKGKNVCFVYGGAFEITKINLKLMISELGVDICHVTKQQDLSALLGIDIEDIPELLVTVDSQYGEGNIQHFEAKKIAVIDHHQISEPLTELAEVRPYLASCSTLMWDMLKDEDYLVDDDLMLSTALYYGLITDSNNFSEIHHPLDMDMRDDLKYSSASINRFKNSNISQEELRIAGIALLGSEYHSENHYSIVKTDPCDPNVLGIISDMLLEVEDVDCCLAYTIHEGGIKLSVRSCVKEVKANELAKFICDGVGNGGGHKVKAGGSIIKSLMEKKNLDYSQSSIQEFFRERMRRYFTDSEIIYTNDYKPDIENMQRYKSKRVVLGYAKASDILPVGSKAVIRSLEGDVEFDVRKDTYIVLGVRGEVYVASERLYNMYYEQGEGDYIYPADYEPSIKNVEYGVNMSLLEYIKPCIFVCPGYIYARELHNRTKIFTRRSPEDYALGNPGDYIVVTTNCDEGVYILDKELFEKVYAPVE